IRTRAIARDHADRAAVGRRNEAVAEHGVDHGVGIQVAGAAAAEPGAADDRAVLAVDAVAAGAVVGQVLGALQVVAVAEGQRFVQVVLGGGDDAAAVEVPAVGAGDLEDLAAAGEGHAHGRGEFRAIDVLAGDQVDHAGDRVGAVDGGRAVLHDLGALQDAGRDHVQVEGADLAAGTGRAGTLAVEQDQGAVLTQATQGEGLHASTAFDDEA